MVLSRVHPPLSSAYLKLIRAQEHLDPLVFKIRQYEMSRPYGYVRETDFEAGEHLVYAVMRPPPGDEWYGPLGDLVHNLRSALDHAVYGLSIYCQGRALTDAEARSVEWPVYTDPAKWQAFLAAGMPAIRLLSRPYQEVIEREQPHSGGNEYIRASHPMHVLHSLWNLDKHREISFFAGFGKVVALYVAGDLGVPYGLTPPVVDNGSEVVHVPIGRVQSKEDLNPVVLVEVALQEGGPPRNPMTSARHPIGGFLGYLHNAVFDVLDQFTDLLERGVR